MNKKSRQYLGLVLAVLAYYIIHEGAHLLLAILMGVFKTIHFMGVGIQIDVFAEQMNDVQMFSFCAAGAMATALVAYLLVAFTPKFASHPNKVVRAVMYYVTLVLLFLDPLYLSVVFGFVGGGDMNGLTLFLPEMVVRVFFGLMLLVNVWLFWRRVLPLYSQSFAE